MAKKRRTPAEIARERAIDEATNKASLGLQLPIFEIPKMSEAAGRAYDVGEDVYAATRKVAEAIAVPTTQRNEA